jgi:ubiquitin-conjugating enzyme E2 O
MLWCRMNFNLPLFQLNLDGTVQVTHPDFSIGVYPLDRLTQLYDGMEQLENDIWGEGEDDNEEEDKSVWMMDESGVWLPHTEDEGDWEDVPEEEMNVQGDVGIEQDLHNRSKDKEIDEELNPLSQNSVPNKPDDILQNTIDSEQEEPPDFWTPFKILNFAPVDHGFYSSSPAQQSKSFLARLRKEYRVLDNSLPGPCIQLKSLKMTHIFDRDDSCSRIRRPD